jgi:hypothetical protein
MSTESNGRGARLVAQLTQAAGSSLPVGESVQSAVRVNLQGTVAATAAAALGGRADDELEASADQAAGAGFPTNAQQAIGVTDRHLVVCSRGGLSGKPKSFLTAIPLSQVAAVEHEPGRMGDTLTFTMRSGASTTFQSVKVDPGAEFAAAVQARISSRG